MSDLKDRDWELVNAFHDGELTPEDTKAFRTRLANEPQMAAAFSDVSGVSASLRAMRPQIAQASFNEGRPVQASAMGKLRLLTWLSGGAVAASLLAVAFMGHAHFAAETPFDAHRDLAAQQFIVDQSDFKAVAASAFAGLPDLRAASLVPVTMRDFAGGTVGHYAGRNGCRLSYFRSSGDQAFPDAGRVQAATWSTTDGQTHAIIATGMDAARFQAIFAYLKMATQREATKRVTAALTTATNAATPCIG